MKRRRKQVNSEEASPSRAECSGEGNSASRPRTRRRVGSPSDAAASPRPQPLPAAAAANASAAPQHAAADAGEADRLSTGVESASDAAANPTWRTRLRPRAQRHTSEADSSSGSSGSSSSSSSIIGYMQRLATVELQSIMHFLDPDSLLAFARCSRWLHSAADSSFAWQYVEPFYREMRAAVSAAWSSRFSASLVRHVGTELHWAAWLDSIDAELALIQQQLPPRCKKLDVWRPGLQPAQWERLCRFPQMASLADLAFSYTGSPPLGFTRPLQQLQQLHTLELIHCTLAAGETLDGLPLISRLAVLTLSELTFEFGHGQPALHHANAGRLYDSIAQCRSLTHLTLDSPLLDQPLLHRLLQSPTLAASLQRLELWSPSLADESLTLSPASLAALQHSFGHLTSLRHLSLRPHHAALGDLLLHIARWLPLERLELSFRVREAHLSPAVVQQLLSAAPAMHLSYRVGCNSPYRRIEYESLLSAEQRTRLTFSY